MAALLTARFRIRARGCRASLRIRVAATLLVSLLFTWAGACGDGSGDREFSSPEKLAFIARSDDGGNIYLVDAEGGGWQSLLAWQGYGERFSFSNDGRFFQIALLTMDLVAATDGSSVMFLPKEYGLLAFSPDSTRVAFITSPEEGANGLGVIDLASGETRMLYMDDGLLVNPTWVDDTTLIYTRLDTDAMEPIKAGGVIFSIDVASGVTRRLTEADRSFSTYNAPVSFEQSAVALVEKGPLHNIWSLDVVSGELRQVSNNTLYQVRAGYLPGSNTILFEQLKSLDDVPSSELCLLADDGSSYTLLTSNFFFDGLHSFSVDGDRIVYSQVNRDGESSIWTMSSDGSDEKMIAESSRVGLWLGDPVFARVPGWQQVNPLEMEVDIEGPDGPLRISIANTEDTAVAAVLRAFPGDSISLAPAGDRPAAPTDGGTSIGSPLEYDLRLEPGESIEVLVAAERLAADTETIDEAVFLSLAVEGAAPLMQLRYLDTHDS